MSSTNKTLTIELSQYVGTDKPTYLSDYNGDMLKIDNAIAADRDSITTAQGKADGADAKADANATAIQSLDGQINNASNGLTKRVTDVEGDVNTIESLIGNGTPTTTDKTIIGAINELDIIKLDISALTASAVPVAPISGMTATNVQSAIEELSGAQLPSWSTVGDIQYRKVGNIVEVRCYKDDVADGTTLGTLPEAYRPTDNILTPNGINSGTSRIMITAATGAIVFQSSGNSNCRYHDVFLA